MSQSLAVDYEYITECIRKDWNGWNYTQRSTWEISHDLPISIADFDYLPTKIQDALFCEYLDNSKKNLD